MKKFLRVAFRLRIFLLLLATCWLLAGAFMVFQFYREKEYKIDVMDARLQVHNRRILDDMRRGEDIADIVARINTPVEDLRVTLINRDGDVVYDSRNRMPASNHNSRPEVVAARSKGEGFAIERLSESDDTNYFYSALLGDGGDVIRSAAPYSHGLTEFLRVDSTIIWIMAVITLAVTTAGLLATRTIAVSIRRLSLFAQMAERGEKIYTGYHFPHDELGDIAANIVKLYVQRDEQHRATMRLEQDKARLKKQLTNNINHELKTPVAAILVNLELLDDNPGLPEDKKRKLMERIRANAERLSALLKDVSTITRMDDAPDMIDKADVDLTALVGEVADEARQRTDMTITVEMPQLTVHGNSSLLESVFRNLIDNAVAYSGGTQINITADAAGNFHFSDNGRGIPTEHLSRIFERFYRVDAGRSRDAGGTGLGLSIVRNAVVIHGGTIRAYSANGLHFVFTLRPV